MQMLETSLCLIILLVLILPFLIHPVERNIEVFLLIMGVLAATFSHFWGSGPVWSIRLIKESLVEPLMITSAVMIVGLLVHHFRDLIARIILKLERKTGSRLFCFTLIAGLGVLSSVITAIMAAIILVEVANALKLNKEFETRLVVLGCFAIGLGAALTPIGEPLSTICIAKLKGEPYNANFFFLIKTIGVFALPGILFVAILGAIIPSVKESPRDALKEKEKSSIKGIFVYSGKVYIFIMALIYLGAGFKQVTDLHIIVLPNSTLYWMNSISAVLDNATLAAAEISPKMNLSQIQYILIGLLISGGMLIPGNIPNIISAKRLGVTSKQWAKTGVPLGLFLMAAYFVIFSLNLK